MRRVQVFFLLFLAIGCHPSGEPSTRHIGAGASDSKPVENVKSDTTELRPRLVAEPVSVNVIVAKFRTDGYLGAISVRFSIGTDGMTRNCVVDAEKSLNALREEICTAVYKRIYETGKPAEAALDFPAPHLR